MKHIVMDKDVKSILRVLVIIVVFFWLAATTIKAQEIKIQGDIVSSYVWRGMYQSGAAVQPTLGLNINNFSLTAWGSVDFNGEGKKEADITAAYSVSGITVSLSDYWWVGQSSFRGMNNGENNYFKFNNHKTSHILEAGLSYTFPIEKFPLNLSWYTMVWGADKNNRITDVEGNMIDYGSQAYSSYCELNYPFSVKGVTLNTIVGFSPFESHTNYCNESFAFTNVSLKATKEIQFTDKFSLPVYSQLIWNPNREDVHFVFGIVLR